MSIQEQRVCKPLTSELAVVDRIVLLCGQHFMMYEPSGDMQPDLSWARLPVLSGYTLISRLCCAPLVLKL